MTVIRRASLAASTALLLAAPAALSAQDAEIGGQIRPRYEARDPGTDQGSITFTSMRSRVDFTVPLESWFTAFIQVQDVRFWGEEEGTLDDDADGLDVHQAWVDIGSARAPLGVRVGRQEVSFGGERLVGALDWAPQARAFDGVVARAAANGFRTDLFGFQLGDADVDPDGRDEAFYGSWTAWTPMPGHTLHLHVLWNRDEGVVETDQWTPGLRYEGRAGAADYRIQGAWQTGERRGLDVEDAWLLAARLGAPVAEGRGHVALWYDHLSGDDGTTPGATSAFHTLFATNHKFYGYADLFTDIPAHTQGRGLRDLAVKTRWTGGSPWTVTLDLHHFRVAEDRDLGSARLGEEIDLTLGRTLASGARLSGGLAWVGSGDALAELRNIEEDVLFGYVMLDVVF